MGPVSGASIYLVAPLAFGVILKGVGLAWSGSVASDFVLITYYTIISRCTTVIYTDVRVCITVTLNYERQLNLARNSTF